MNYKTFVWVTLIQLTCLKECCFSNSTQITSTSTNRSEVTETPSLNSTVAAENDETHLELLEIFHGGSNVTNVTRNATNASALTDHALHVTGVDNNDDPSVVLSSNDTFKANYTLTSEAALSPLTLESTSAIAAGVFLVSAVVGYFGCVGYRRFMQKKYGNSQILVGEDVYDTSDLRYFEI